MMDYDVDDTPEVVCANCDWMGRILELHEDGYGVTCPKCGSEEIMDHEPETLDHGGPEWQG